MKYKCVENFSVEKYNDYGFYESESMIISAGSVWERDKSENRIIGGDVKLDNPETMEWLEIPFSTFTRCFVQLN